VALKVLVDQCVSSMLVYLSLRVEFMLSNEETLMSHIPVKHSGASYLLTSPNALSKQHRVNQLLARVVTILVPLAVF
jgi:hypothetical protein